MIKMSIKKEWLGKLWYIYTAEYYYKKERIWVICNDVDGPRICHTKWSNSETEKQIIYINIYKWNLEKWCSWTYMQGRDRGAENGKVGTGKDEEGGMDWESSADMWKTVSGKLPHSSETSSLWWPRRAGCGVRGRSKREGINVYIWPILFIVRQKLARYCKAIRLSFTNKRSKIAAPSMTSH